MNSNEIYLANSEQMEKWAERFHECRFNMEMNYDQMKDHFTKKYNMSGDDYEELCEKIDVFLEGRGFGIE